MMLEMTLASCVCTGKSMNFCLQSTLSALFSVLVKSTTTCSKREGPCTFFNTSNRTNHRRDIKNVALIRIEQLSPFPFDHVQREMSRYPNAEIVWCQEEPKNQGAWTYIYFFLKTTLQSLPGDTRKIKYVGRAPSASPATGSSYIHKKEQKELLSDALAEFAKN